MTTPLWLQRMSDKSRARLLGKAHAIVKDFQHTSEFPMQLQKTAENLWMLKAYYEDKADDKRQ